MTKGIRRDVLLAVLAKAKQKVACKVEVVCLIANQLHLLLKITDEHRIPC